MGKKNRKTRQQNRHTGGGNFGAGTTAVAPKPAATAAKPTTSGENIPLSVSAKPQPTPGVTTVTVTALADLKDVVKVPTPNTETPSTKKEIPQGIAVEGKAGYFSGIVTNTPEKGPILVHSGERRVIVPANVIPKGTTLHVGDSVEFTESDQATPCVAQFTVAGNEITKKLEAIASQTKHYQTLFLSGKRLIKALQNGDLANYVCINVNKGVYTFVTDADTTPATPATDASAVRRTH